MLFIPKLDLKLKKSFLRLSAAVEKVASSPSDTENTNVWIVVGVVIPLMVVVVIISILYWKLCRTDKLEFQPDAMTSIQQRQKVEFNRGHKVFHIVSETVFLGNLRTSGNFKTDLKYFLK